MYLESTIYLKRLIQMSELINHLKDESILITGHINPDGDALGSALALKLIFQSKGIESDVYFDKTTKMQSIVSTTTTMDCFKGLGSDNNKEVVCFVNFRIKN